MSAATKEVVMKEPTAMALETDKLFVINRHFLSGNIACALVDWPMVIHTPYQLSTSLIRS